MAQAENNSSTNNNASNDPMQVDEDQIPQQQQQPPAFKQQSQLVTEQQQYPVIKGETWCLVEYKWFQAYKKYINHESDQDVQGGPHPGPIDNTPLIQQDEQQQHHVASSSDEPIIARHPNTPVVVRLKTTVAEGKEYELVPEKYYQKLSAWFGGGPSISRHVIEIGDVRKMTTVEIHPVTVLVTKYTMIEANMPDRPMTFFEMVFSKATKLQELKDQVSQIFEVDTDQFETRLWATYAGSPYRDYRANELSRELQAILTRTDGQQLLLEVRDKLGSTDNDGGWPLGYKHSSTVGGQRTGIAGMQTGFFKTGSIGSNDTGAMVSKQEKSLFSNEGDGKGGIPGVCGLSNLGNTCFMNSALQCLSKTSIIKDYFVTGDYKKEINLKNPLGMQGKIASAFGNLMEEIWNGKNSYATPREFKHIIGKYQPQFSGYQQQDSQELISYLLDGLHEDLNRVKVKPTTEPVESKGRADAIVAAEAWATHVKRNDSIVVDKFQGQSRSTLVCPEPECVQDNHVSIIFDPFMHLPLPMPIERNRVVDVTLYRFGNNNPPIKYGVKAPKQGNVVELRTSLANLINENAKSEEEKIKAEDIALADVFQSKVYRFLPDTSQVQSITDSDVIMGFEIPGLTKEVHQEYEAYSTSSQSKLPPFMAVRLATIEKYESMYYATQYRIGNIGVPFAVPYDKNKTTKKELYDHCFQNVKRYLKLEEVTNVNWNDHASFLPAKPKSATQQPAAADADRMQGVEEQSGDRTQTQQQPEEENTMLFELKWDNPYASSAEEIKEAPMSYCDELATVAEADEDDDEDDKRYMYHHRMPKEKKSLLMIIPSDVLAKLVDKEKFSSINVHSTGKAPNKQMEKGVSLYDCVQLYTTKEKLGPDDAWYCSKCKKHVQATKKLDIWKLPEILVIQLKRFQFTRFSRDKLETFIDYPLDTLDLTQYVPVEAQGQQHLQYDLFAVSNHFGGLGGGHYTAYSKIDSTSKWYKFDDSSTQEVDPQIVKTPAAYVLFYKSKNATKADVKPEMQQPDV